MALRLRLSCIYTLYIVNTNANICKYVCPRYGISIEHEVTYIFELYVNRLYNAVRINNFI